jgi:hypothetical protein
MPEHVLTSEIVIITDGGRRRRCWPRRGCPIAAAFTCRWDASTQRSVPAGPPRWRHRLIECAAPSDRFVFAVDPATASIPCQPSHPRSNFPSAALTVLRGSETRR